ncbi:MAG: hypothetical protein ACM3PE_12120 [Deltaproteobacteria bacterium]
MVKKLIYILIVLLAFVAGAVVGVSLNPDNLNRIPTVEAAKADTNTAKDNLSNEKAQPVAGDKIQTTLVGKWQFSYGTNQRVLEFLADGSGKDHSIVGTNDSVSAYNWEVIDSTHVKFDYSNSLEIVTMNLTQDSLTLTFADGKATVYKRVG